MTTHPTDPAPRVNVHEGPEEVARAAAERHLAVRTGDLDGDVGVGAANDYGLGVEDDLITRDTCRSSGSDRTPAVPSATNPRPPVMPSRALPANITALLSCTPGSTSGLRYSNACR